MTAPIGSPVRSANRCGSIFSPAFFNSAASDGICCGIHIPSAPNTALVAASARIPIKSFFTRSPSVVRWDQIERDATASRIQSVSTAYRRRSFPRLTRERSRTILFGMKKAPEEDELRPYYEFDYSKMKPNRFAREKKIHKESFVTDEEADSKPNPSKPQDDASD